MKNFSDVRLNVYLTQETHARLKAWAHSRGQTIQGAVSVSIGEMVAKVELAGMPKLDLTGVRRAPGFEESASDEPTDASQPDPHGFVSPKALPGSELSTQQEAVAKYQSLLSAGEWIPDALAKVDEIWNKNGLIYMWHTVELSEYIKDEYREQAKAAGRDPEPDLRLHENTTERM